MRYPVILSLLLVLVALTLVGCQESESAQIQKARLVGSENLRLKQEIKEKDKEIKQLKAEITQIQAEKAKASEEAGTMNIQVLQMLATSEKKAEALAEENKRLNEEIKKLKAQ